MLEAHVRQKLAGGGAALAVMTHNHVVGFFVQRGRPFVDLTDGQQFRFIQMRNGVFPWFTHIDERRRVVAGTQLSVLLRRDDLHGWLH